MGSGDWIRTIIKMKKIRPSKSKNSEVQRPIPESTNVKTEETDRPKSSQSDENSYESGNFPAVLDDRGAAIRIQAAFRRHQARETFELLRRNKRLKSFSERNPVKIPAASAVKCVLSWNKIQSEISARRRSIPFDRRIAEKKPGDKKHGREENWIGGQLTRDEIIARRRQRGEAVTKRERALAYAFAHQHRVNSGVKVVKQAVEQGEQQWSWSWSWSWSKETATNLTRRTT